MHFFYKNANICYIQLEAMLSNLYNLYLAHKHSKLTNSEFFKIYNEGLSKITIGCSFNPEHWVFDAVSKSEQDKENITLECAKFIIEELKITNIRLSIRWSKVYDGKKINFSYYEKLFKYFFGQNIDICLNLGPIKTMRWPEEQVPSIVLDNLENIPAHKKVLTSQDELVSKSKEYLILLLEFVSKHFTHEELEKISIVQANNECFNKFGEHGWIFSPILESEYINTIRAYFPDKKILLNSSGRNDMQRNLNLIEKTKIPSNKFILGYNYYYKVPGQADNFVLKYLDNLILAMPLSIGTAKLIKLGQNQNFDIEVSELQGEPWMHIKSPGNSVSEFRFALIRSINSMLNLNNNESSIIRYWGIEDIVSKKMLKQETGEQSKILELISSINQ